MDLRWAEAFEAAAALDAPLAARLDAMRTAAARLAPDYAALLDDFAARLAAAEVGAGAPRIGETLPDFALPDETGRIVRLDALRDEGPVVVAFHRGGWCDFCRLSLAALADATPAILAAGARVVVIAPQRAQGARRWRAASGAVFPLLCDVEGGYATTLGLTAALGAPLQERLAAFGLDLAAINGDGGATLPVPATFVVGRDGRVLARWLDPDPRRRAEPAAILQALGAAP